MVGLNLLQQAEAAGLLVWRSGEALCVRGPKHAESLAKELLGHKADVLRALDARQVEMSRPAKAGDIRSGLEIHLVNLGNETLEVQARYGKLYFRRDPAAGWTACSPDLGRRIHEQLSKNPTWHMPDHWPRSFPKPGS